MTDSKIIPIWKSHYSLGRSILTLEKEGSSKEEEPDSIIDLCVKNGMKDLYLVEDGFSSFLEAFNNCRASNLNLRFGLRVTMCQDMADKSEESFLKCAKYVIFIKNANGYRRLIKMYAAANQSGFYYEPRLDFKTLKEHWDDQDLSLVIPFYDSFIHQNHFNGRICMPEFGDIKPTFFVEDNDLIPDDQLRKRVQEYAGEKFEIIETKSIYYKARKDFLAYMTFRCITSRTALDKPELNGMTSPEFCLESYLERAL